MWRDYNNIEPQRPTLGSKGKSIMRLKRRNVTWLAMLGALIAIAIISGAASPLVALALMMLFAAALVFSVVDVQPRQLVESVQRGSLMRNVSPQGREATERARRRGGMSLRNLLLMDVGMITTQTGGDGVVMRRTRSISKDEDGARPFITLNVPGSEAERQTTVRFEIKDHTGKTQFVHEQRVYLRDGEMPILCDHQLPLAGNSDLTGAGDWDLQVYIDGGLAAVHGFNVTPSIEDRFGRRREQADRAADRLQDRPAARRLPSDEELPLSLEDLLRNQSRK
jgi:hypothetical protein